MNWDAIAAIGEILGATGVIVTLAYLASQIKQNTQATRSAALQSLAETGATMNAMIVGDEEVARIWRIGLSPDSERLNRDEWTRFTHMIAQWILAYESVFLQHLIGTVQDELFESRMENLRLWLNTPGGLQAFQASRDVFAKPYIEYVEENLIEQHAELVKNVAKTEEDA